VKSIAAKKQNCSLHFY